MSTHNICFQREIRKVLSGYPLLSRAMIVDVNDLPRFLATLEKSGKIKT